MKKYLAENGTLGPSFKKKLNRGLAILKEKTDSVELKKNLIEIHRYTLHQIKVGLEKRHYEYREVQSLVKQDS